MPVAAFGLQWYLWPATQPYVWFFFFPAVYLTSWARDFTERKQAEQALRQRVVLQNQIEQVAETVPGMIYSFRLRPDGSMCMPYASPALEALFGLEQEAVREDARPIMEMIHPHDAGRVNESIAISAETMAPWREEFRVRHTCKGEHWMEGHSVPEMQPDGSILWNGFFQDITDRKHADEQLRKLSRAVEQSYAAIVITNRKGEIDYVNPRFEVLTGYTLEEVRGKNPRILRSGEIPDAEFTRLWRTITRGEIWRGEFHNRKKDGTFFWESACVSPVLDEAGRITHFLAVKEDITERKQTEVALKLFRALIERSGDAIYVVDPETGKFLDVNARAFKSLGYTRDELLGMRVFDVAMGVDRELFDNTGAKTRDGKQATLEVMHRRKDGTTFPVEVSVSHVRLDRDYLVGNVRDISERNQRIAEQRQLEEQLRQSQKMEGIGQLAGGVAHDFNNILGAMMLQTELAEITADVPEGVKEDLRQIRGAVERAANLTRQLLLFSRKQVMQPRNLDLNEAVTSLAKMLRRIIGEDIRLVLNLDPRPMMTRADPGMIDQMLMNLTVNARDAMPEGGRITIETGEATVDEEVARQHADAIPGNYVSMVVRDTGTGIPPETMSRIFEPFFTTKEAGKGTGLGLATVFGIVKQHHGWITVESEPGQGTSFSIYLPASEVSARDADAETAEPEPCGGTETILVAEDDLNVRMLTRELLELNGYRVLEAASGPEALQIWEGNGQSVELLVTDLVMPGGITGQRLARQLQTTRPNLKVVFMSGYSSEIAGRALELKSGENFLQKPFAPCQLLETVRRSLDG